MKRICLIFFCVVSAITALAQKPEFQLGLQTFFDNTEFAHAAYRIPQTMAGVHVQPSFGIGFQKNHHIRVGVDLMHEYGSDKAVGYYSPIAYYEFDNKPIRFLSGAFPREYAVEKFPRIFFQDSIANYRPAMNGLAWEFTKNNSYANVWLDWTGRQSASQHETFLLGWSGKLSRGSFYAQHFGYLFHFAGKLNPAVNEALHDNGLVLTSLGLDLAKRTGFEKLELNVGYAAGLERAREGNGDWHTQRALLAEIKAEYRGLGIFHTWYTGNGQMYFYNDHHNELYWGDPMYQADSYNRTDIYVNFLNSEQIQVRLTYSLHFAEGKTFHEQMLRVSFDINRFGNGQKTAPRFIWDHWFN